MGNAKVSERKRDPDGQKYIKTDPKSFYAIKTKPREIIPDFVPKSTECYRDVNLILCVIPDLSKPDGTLT